MTEPSAPAEPGDDEPTRFALALARVAKATDLPIRSIERAGLDPLSGVTFTIRSTDDRWVRVTVRPTVLLNQTRFRVTVLMPTGRVTRSVSAAEWETIVGDVVTAATPCTTAQAVAKALAPTRLAGFLRDEPGAVVEWRGERWVRLPEAAEYARAHGSPVSDREVQLAFRSAGMVPRKIVHEGKPGNFWSLPAGYPPATDG